MADYSIAVKIAGELASSFQSSIKGAQSGLAGLAGAAGKLGGLAMKGAADGIGAASTAAIGLGTTAVNVGKEFESAMSQVSATMLLDRFSDDAEKAAKAQKAYETLENAARECGASTAFSATEAAEGLNYLALAGYDAEKAAAALPTVLKLAGAGAMSLGDASDMVTDAMSALNIEATQDNLNAFADNLAMTASKSNTSVAQLGEAILTVGGTAQGLKGGTTELSAIAGILADSGIKASEGGTHIRNMIQSLQMPRNDKAAGLFKALGLEAYDAAGDMRSLGEVFGDLNKRMLGATAEGVNETLATIFKQTDLAAARAMMAATADTVDALGVAVDASLAESGTSMAQLGINLNDMAKGFDTAMSQEAFAAQAMKQFGITGEQAGVIYSGLQSVVSGTGNRFEELSGLIEESAGACQDMYDIQLDNLEGDLKILGSAASDLGISFYKDVNGPLRAVTQTASNMVTQLNNAYKSGGLPAMLTEVGDCMAQMVNGIAQYAPQAVNVGIDLLQSLIDGIMQNSGGIASAAGDVLTAFAGGIFQLAPQIAFAGIDIIVQLADSLTAQAPQLLAGGMQAVAGFVDGLVQRGPDIADAALGLIQVLVSGIAANAPTLAGAAIQLIGGLFSGFVNMLPQLVQMGIQLINSLAQGIQANLPGLVPAAMQALMNFSGTLRENAGGLVDAGLNLVTALAQSLIAGLPVFIQTVPAIITNLAGIINDNAPKLLSTGIQLAVQLLVGMIQAVPTIVANIPQMIQAIVSVFTAFNWAALGSQAITLIGNGIRTAVTSIPQIFSSFVQTAHSIVSSFGWQSLGRGIIQVLGNGISSMITAIPQIFLHIGGFAVQAIKSIDWWNVGVSIIQFIGEAISGAGGFLIDAVKGIGGSIIDGIKGIFGGGGEDGAAKESAASTVSSYASSIQDNAGAVTGAASTLSTAAFSGMDFTAATTAGTQSASAFSIGITEGIAGLNMDMSGMGLDSTAIAENFGQAGAEGAAALGESLNTGLAAASADTGIQMTQISTTVQDNFAQANTAAKQNMTQMTGCVQSGMSAMVSAVQSGGTQMVQAAASAAQGIRNAFSGIDLSWSGTNMIQGLVRGIRSMQPQAEAAARDVAQAAAASVNSALQIHSPSRLMDQSGRFVDEGFAGGMLKNAGIVKSAAQAAMAQPVAETGAGMQDSMSRPFSDMRAGVQGGGRVRSALDGIISSSSTVNNRTENNSAVSRPTFVFSPTYQIHGGAGRDDVVKAGSMSQAEFEKRAKEFIRRYGRIQFA